LNGTVFTFARRHKTTHRKHTVSVCVLPPQDAHEFYNFIINDMAEALLALVNRDLPEGAEPAKSTWVHDLFQGVLTNETKCMCCETVSAAPPCDALCVDEQGMSMRESSYYIHTRVPSLVRPRRDAARLTPVAEYACGVQAPSVCLMLYRTATVDALACMRRKRCVLGVGVLGVDADGETHFKLSF
jgi:Ubiquitin carboxyl-terminal hydrolase